MPTAHDKNNLIAGAFLFGALALFLATSFVIRQISFEPRTSYIVRFPISTGAQGITQGSFVHLGGQVVGEVDDVNFFPSREAPESVDVAMKVDAEIVLYENATVFLRTPLLGSGSDLNIAGVGDPETLETTLDGDPRLTENEVVRGRTAPPAFLSDAGWGEEQSLALQRIIANADETVASVRTTATEAGDWWRENRDRANTAIADFEALAARARELGDQFPTYDEQVQATLGSARSFAEGLGPFGESLDRAGENANKVIADVEDVVADIDAAVEENRPGVRATVADASAAAARINEETVPAIRAGADQFDEAMARFQALIDTEAPNIRATLANARLASDQLKLTMVEVRNQPWRLLITPDTKEIERQLLYDAARSYAAAAGDLKAASESLESLLASPTSRPSGVDSIAAELSDAMERYRAAEDRLLDRLIAEQR